MATIYLTKNTESNDAKGFIIFEGKEVKTTTDLTIVHCNFSIVGVGGD